MSLSDFNWIVVVVGQSRTEQSGRETSRKIPRSLPRFNAIVSRLALPRDSQVLASQPNVAQPAEISIYRRLADERLQLFEYVTEPSRAEPS